MTTRTLTDEEALNRIRDAMSGAEWTSDLWDVVAELVLATGRLPFLPPDEETER